MDDNEVTKGKVIRTCKLKFSEEWMLDPDAIARIESASNDLVCIHLQTDPVNDVLGYAPDGMPVLKSVFLKFDRQLKHAIVSHYRDMDFHWVDIVCLKRHNWKIFLFRSDANTSIDMFTPWSTQDQIQRQVYEPCLEQQMFGFTEQE
jgi:hypothetical protein